MTEKIAKQLGKENPHVYHDLGGSSEKAPHTRRRDLGDVERANHSRGASSDARKEAAENHKADIVSER
jgi:hypothetical protein